MFDSKIQITACRADELSFLGMDKHKQGKSSQCSVKGKSKVPAGSLLVLTGTILCKISSNKSNFCARTQLLLLYVIDADLWASLLYSSKPMKNSSTASLTEMYSIAWIRVELTVEVQEDKMCVCQCPSALKLGDSLPTLCHIFAKLDSCYNCRL